MSSESSGSHATFKSDSASTTAQAFVPSGSEDTCANDEELPKVRRRLLVVDDDPGITAGLRLRLRSGFDVVTAESGPSAIQLFEQLGEFPVIISDLRMPGMDGIALLEHVRNHFPNTVRIMLSGTVDMAAAVRAVNNGGIQRLLLKPAQPGELEATLASAFADYDARMKERALALEDPLLLIGTRRAFDLAAQRVYGHAVRHQRAIAVVMADVDYFKRFNDTYGHQAGDDVLRRVAQAVRSTMRVSDEIFRYGGEELVMLLPDTVAGGAQIVLERYRASVFELGILHSASEHGQVTVSLGAAVSLPENHIEFTQLVERADQALYRSKHAGRNRGTVWEPFER